MFRWLPSDSQAQGSFGEMRFFFGTSICRSFKQLLGRLKVILAGLQDKRNVLSGVSPKTSREDCMGGQASNIKNKDAYCRCLCSTSGSCCHTAVFLLLSLRMCPAGMRLQCGPARRIGEVPDKVSRSVPAKCRLKDQQPSLTTTIQATTSDLAA